MEGQGRIEELTKGNISRNFDFSTLFLYILKSPIVSWIQCVSRKNYIHNTEISKYECREASTPILIKILILLKRGL